MTGIAMNMMNNNVPSLFTSNLLIYLDADNASSYSGSGTSVNDLSGNGYTHTLSNSKNYQSLRSRFNV
jgi:hypothetical protein